MRWSGKFLPLVLLTLAVLLGAANPRQVRSESAKQNRIPKNSREQAATDQRGTDKLPISVKLLNTGKNEQKAAQAARQEQTADSTNWWTIRLALAAIFISGLQLIAYSLQAARLKETITVMRENGERQLRAYVIANAGDVKEEADSSGNHTFEWRVQITNVGQTPAYNLGGRGCVSILPYPLPDNFDFPYPDSVIEDAPTAIPIGPQDPKLIPFSLEKPCTAEEVAALKSNGNLKLWLYGIVKYVDVFKRPRYTNFCFYIMWEGDRARGRTYGRTHHNDAN
jgi:hypothetical protein